MIDLEKGVSLIEASAGTGKTYTLCRIALRLTLEKGVPLDRILAVTFTEAATDELRQRLRTLYQDCLQQLETGESYEEPTLSEIEDLDRQQAIRRLRYSLAVFDESPISTIHGFCKRALDLVALETGTPFDAEIEPVEDQLTAQLQNEYLRQHVVEASHILSLELKARGNAFFSTLRAIGKESAAHPKARTLPAAKRYSLKQLNTDFQNLPAAILDLVGAAEHLARLLKGNTKTGKLLKNRIEDLKTIAAKPHLSASDWSLLKDTLTPEAFLKALNKDGQGTALPAICELVQRLDEGLANAFDTLAANYPSWLRQRLAEAKEARNVMSFNDLLGKLGEALRHDEDGTVAELVASRFDAALIDEFQDTDPLQYEIAMKLFGQGQHALFFIGDPKQAIYRFRGADIFAYFQATRLPGIGRIALADNYRSTPEVVAAINQLFSYSKTGFAYEEIAYQPVTAKRRDLQAPFQIHAPLRIAQVPTDASHLAQIGQIRKTLAETAADDFVRQLNREPRPKPECVAFLVNDRHEADLLAAALQKRGISPDIRAERSIFSSPEAQDFEILLHHLSQPTRLPLKRAVYTTSFCGYGRRELQIIEGRDRSWFDKAHHPELVAGPSGPHCKSPVQPSADRSAIGPYHQIAQVDDLLATWARTWFDHPFDLQTLRLMELCQAAERIAGQSGGERKLGDLLHLAEVLSEARDAQRLSPRALLNWLKRNQESDTAKDDNWLTRLSSDTGKPQIVTIHKSKGLEFPFVICPFVSLLRQRKRPSHLSYHQQREGRDELVLDFTKPADSPGLETSLKEELSEKIRLLYVALTRAVYGNVLYLGPEEMERSYPSVFAQFMLGEDIRHRPFQGGETTAELLQAVKAIAAGSEGAIHFQELEETGEIAAWENRQPSPGPSPVARKFRGKPIPGPARILSFSSLSRGLHAIEADDRRDEAPVRSLENEATPEEVSIFSLQKGTKTGDLLHMILERFDFQRPASLSDVTQEAFRELQFEPVSYERPVAEQISLLADLPLHAPDTTFKLSDIPAENRIAELEFAYSLAGDARRGIAAAFQNAQLGRIPKAWTAKLRQAEGLLGGSFLRGFIDLVIERDERFYIFDWKSNHLGNESEAYTQPKMLEAMAQHDYFLQYCLYCVALKRFIEFRYPGEDFHHRIGGVFYIFIRGLQSGTSNGVFFDLPSKQLLQRLDQNLSK